jgi:hypothetical protein
MAVLHAISEGLLLSFKLHRESSLPRNGHVSHAAHKPLHAELLKILFGGHAPPGRIAPSNMKKLREACSRGLEAWGEVMRFLTWDVEDHRQVADGPGNLQQHPAGQRTQ